MSEVHVTIMAGLGFVFSNGIVDNLNHRLAKIPGVLVRVGSYYSWREFASLAAKADEEVRLVGIGHSLGAAVLPEWARTIGGKVEGIFGFDAADNPAANLSEYRLTKVPTNVKVARTVFVPGGALGGGGFEAVNSDLTLAENWPIDTSHTSIDEAVEEHLVIEEFVRRLAA